ncbi:MAG: membrane protein insertion efficiency factor YidD [Gammaproteobacteria bacterium]|nr:MAG: membrane protein insertion efficiency factor YidD [Gammaproteobacteria bacterium]
MKKYIRLFFITLIKTYQITISPFLGNNCRFNPTCSSYMIEAITKHGTVEGIKLGMKRISKCHPFGNKGFDPVPLSNKEKSK